MKPSETLERMRSLLSRLEHAVESARMQRTGAATAKTSPAAAPSSPIDLGAAPSQQAPGVQSRPGEGAPAPIPFPAPAASGKPKARAKSLEEFDAAFKRLAERQAG